MIHAPDLLTSSLPGSLPRPEQSRAGPPAYASIIARLSGFDGADLLAPLIRSNLRGRVALVSSFGIESAVLLHMVAEIDRSVPVITLDTGKLFPEVAAYRSQLSGLLGLTDVRIVRPDPASMRLLDPEGSLHARDPDACCRIRKVEPLKRALAGFDAWISGRKRFHGGLRANIQTLEMAEGRLKIEPLARFTAQDIAFYMDRYRLPRHPLAERGYLSIGCAPCTARGGTLNDPRAGRWPGREKTECGLHCPRP